MGVADGIEVGGVVGVISGAGVEVGFEVGVAVEADTRVCAAGCWTPSVGFAEQAARNSMLSRRNVRVCTQKLYRHVEKRGEGCQNDRNAL